MNKPKISVISVVFNMEDKIEQNIKNVLEQTYENIEFVIIDGGSNDGTMDVVNKYKGKIDTIVSEPDKGIYDAMNKGWQKATGDYVHYLNVGDLFATKDVLSEVAKILEQESPDFMNGNVLLANKEDGQTSRSAKRIDLRAVKRGRKVVHQAVLMKRSLLEAIGGFSLEYKLAADYDMYCKALKETESILYADIDIVKFDISGASSNFYKVYTETMKVVFANFGIWWGMKYWVFAVIRLIGEKVFGVLGGQKLIDKVRMKTGQWQN